MKNIKSLLVLTFLTCTLLTVSAQKSGFYTGLKAGLGIPNLTAGSKSTPLSEDYTSKLGFYGGVIGEFQGEKRFGLRIELNYSSQGGKRDGLQALPLPAGFEQLWQMLPNLGVSPGDFMFVDVKNKAIINYLEIPVMGKLSFKVTQGLNFYMMAGPYMGILLNAKNVTSGSSSIYLDKSGNIPLDPILQLANLPTVGKLSFDHNENITKDIHKFNTGVQGAIGFELMTGTGKFFIEGGGNYGFISIQKDEANGTNNTGAGTVTVGYLFLF